MKKSKVVREGEQYYLLIDRDGVEGEDGVAIPLDNSMEIQMILEGVQEYIQING